MAATAAREPFAWEPHLAASYGDCGALLHYDPDVRTATAVGPSPLYVNAEYLLECCNSVGDYLEDRISSPVLVQWDTPILGLEGTVDTLTNGRCGACVSMGCNATPTSVQRIIRLAQKQRLLQEGDRPSHAIRCIYRGGMRGQSGKRRPRSMARGRNLNPND